MGPAGQGEQHRHQTRTEPSRKTSTRRPGLLRHGLSLAWILGLVLAGPAGAHQLRPAIVSVLFDDGAFELSLQLNLEAALAGIGPEHEDTRQAPQAAEYDALRALPPAELEARFEDFLPRFLAGLGVRFDGVPATLQLTGAEIPPVGNLAVERLTTVRLTGAIPAGAAAFTWSYPADLGESALRLGTPATGIVRAEWLPPGQTSQPFPLGEGRAGPQSRGEIFRTYTWLGFTHILPLGVDHILFVLGIYLLSLHWRPLLLQVTAFTVAHSITLALALYGVVSLSPAIVEPLIAASIAYVALENVLVRELKPWRIWVVFGFGLLHGLGFADVLLELGLPEGQFLPALVAFNLGVELGQVAVLMLAFLAVGLWFRNRPWYRQRIEIPASLAIAAVGFAWTVERVLGVWNAAQ